MMKLLGYNFTNLRHVMDAAYALQQAGKDEDCKKILEDMAREILE